MMCLLFLCRLYLLLCVGVKVCIEEHIRTHVPETWRGVKISEYGRVIKHG